MPAKPTSRTPADSSQSSQTAELNQALRRAGLASNCPVKTAASVSVNGDLKVAATSNQPKRGHQRKSTGKSACATRREAIAPTLFPMVPPPRDHAASHGSSAASQPPLDTSQPPTDAALRSGKPAPSASADARPLAELTGIARLAASSPLAQEKRSTEYFLLPVRSILNRCDSPRMPFEWTVNPYRGCEFGCKYCYARYTHEYMELDGGEFEKKIFVKQNAGPLFERDLVRKIEPLTSNFQPPEHIAIGTATDPYQPAEREFGVTRAILERIAEREGMSVSITTKSDQVVRDIDLLQRITARSSLTINLSITTPRPRLARLLEPRAPRPDLRFAAVRKLREAGIHAGVFAMPILPGLTDREVDLDALARSARDAGAEWFGGGVLWLMPSSAKQFLPFVEAKFPRLANGYRKWYGRAGYAPEDYRREISARIARLRRKYGLRDRAEFTAPAVRPAPAPPQLLLALAPTSCTITPAEVSAPPAA